MTHVIIAGTGAYLPLRELKNSELALTIDTSNEWIISRTGIESRRVSGEHETTSYMASKAAREAIKEAQLTPNDIDLIIVATCTPDNFFPNTACQVQQLLEISRTIPAFDISAACSGFIYAIDIAKQYIMTGTAKHVLVIGSERMSSAVDWTDRTTCVLFGDGAGACVLSASNQPGILGTALHAQADTSKLLLYPSSGGAKITMTGNEVFKLAVNLMGEIVDEVLTVANLNKSDINWLIPHQANIRIIQAIAKKLDMSMSQVIITLEYQGNTSAASIPLALNQAIATHKVKRGDVLLLESFGGGMTWGAAIVKY